MRKFAGKEIVKEPTPTPGKPDYFEVETTQMKATVHREVLERESGGRVSFVVPELPWKKGKQKTKGRSRRCCR